jgi:hypothetical protein
MEYWSLYLTGLYEFIMFILAIIIMLIVFISYVFILIGGIALVIGIPYGIYYGINKLYRYCANRSNNSNTNLSEDEVTIDLPHNNGRGSMQIESSLQSAENRIQPTKYEHVKN